MSPNSSVRALSSALHLLTISSSVLPFSSAGAGAETETAAAAGAGVAVAPNESVLPRGAAGGFAPPSVSALEVATGVGAAPKREPGAEAVGAAAGGFAPKLKVGAAGAAAGAPKERGELVAGA